MLTPGPATGSRAAERMPDLQARILQVLQAQAGIDPEFVCPEALARALDRRLRAIGEIDLYQYGLALAVDAAEPRRLARALYPGDDNLFLDAEVAAALRRRLVRSSEERLQCWVVDCCEGEEVYALAMRIAMLNSALEGGRDFLVYGTDTDAAALQRASSGVLDPLFAGQVPATLAREHLHPLGAAYAVLPPLARHCVFLSHEALSPAPLFGLDLISGRQILRYLPLPEQRRLLEHWYAALKPGGLLLLGAGETVQGHEDLFALRPIAPGLFQRQSDRTPVAAVIGAQLPLPAETDIAVYRGSFANSSRPSAIVDAEGVLLDVNLRFAELFQLPATALRGRPLVDLLTEADRGRLSELLVSASAPHQLEVAVHCSGRTERMRLHWHPHHGRSIRGHVELAAFDQPLEPTNGVSAMDVAMEALREGLILCDADGRVQRLNRAAQRLTGWSQQEAYGQPSGRVLRLVSDAGELLASPVEECLAKAQPVERPDGSQQLLDRDGRRAAVNVTAHPVLSEGQVSGVVLVIEDIGHRLLLSEELTWRASHDPVTGLLNRDEFEARLRTAVAGTRAGGEPSVLAVLDIDQFRLINDVLGHAAGDELLHELAGELRVRLREGDAFARLSGDEFGILLMGVQQADADLLVRGLLEATRAYRFFWRDQSHSVTASIGVVAIDAETESVGRVLSQADAACYAAKQAGRDCARWMGVDTEASRHHDEMDLVGQMGRALATDRLFLFVEDVVRVDAPDEIVYRELLVRLRGDDGRLIKPAHFIPAAERYYMMNALDRWVARHAFAKLAKLPAGGRSIVYAINVSGQSIGDPEFLEFVLGELDRSGVDPARICFEITETAAVSRLTEAARFVSRLTERGCKFALDDFGVGMSSFGYLKNFPVHFLKIDGSFVRSMRDSQIDLGMVETINRIGHELGLKTIAEHVEDLDVLESLRGIGVDWAQGRGISPGKLLDELLT